MSYFNTFTLKMTLASDAEFRAWTLALHNEIIGSGSGWTVAADTGQMDFATVTAPPSTTLGRYRVYQMTGSPNWFMIIDFYRHSTSNPAMGIQMCSATDGAGLPAAISQKSTRHLLTANGAETVFRTCKLFAYASGLMFVLQYDSTVADRKLMYCVERMKDNAGNDSNGTINPAGINILFQGYNGSQNNNSSQCVPDSGATGTLYAVPLVGSVTVNGIIAPYSGGTNYGGKFSLLPAHLYLGEELPPITLLKGHLLSDIVADSTVSAEVYGVNYDYYCFGAQINRVSEANQVAYMAMRTS